MAYNRKMVREVNRRIKLDDINSNHNRSEKEIRKSLQLSLRWCAEMGEKYGKEFYDYAEAKMRKRRRRQFNEMKRRENAKS